MIQLELTTQEKDTLVEVMKDYLSEVRMEIADTDNSDFKESLRGKKEVLKKILERLS